MRQRKKKINKYGKWVSLIHEHKFLLFLINLGYIVFFVKKQFRIYSKYRFCNDIFKMKSFLLGEK
jgi:hypothetical protein